ncbi:aminotransferase class V-fold PLP-dependent enzyme [Stratiformator vulcanicus]|uniref:Cysteine desulfurase n=1 Tax=Stratiformator vulcanicus TaxID=2527980 RepID=A0A517R1L4_9PLAN|nr:cysteine desulfurase [Stratiformator vulcanicus]QDT37766.1 putative cysteine desulfurase [Stratiformator vulcanicus]
MIPTVDSPTATDVRSDFPIFEEPLEGGKPLIYLDNGATAQKPRVVIEAMTECLSRYYANVHRSKSRLAMRVTEAVEAAREKVRGFINADDASEIIFTSGTTMSINAVAQAWGPANIEEGDVIVLTEMEHHANLVPWQMLAREVGAELKFLPLTDDWQIDLDRIPEVVTERTKLIAVTGLSNVLGTVNPVADLAKAAHAMDAKILVDGAQWAPHEPVDVRELDLDFYIFSGHKLYGPSGIGVLYAKREILDEMPPFLGGGNMIDRVYLDHFTEAEPPAKFEAGTPPIAEIIGLGAAVDYIRNLGWEFITAHEARLSQVAHAKLSAVPGITIYGPAPEHKAAICSFTIEGAAAEDINFLVDRKGIAVRHGHHCTMPLHDKLGVSATTRASFGIYNTEEEVDALVEALLAARKRLKLD